MDCSSIPEKQNKKRISQEDKMRKININSMKKENKKEKDKIIFKDFTIPMQITPKKVKDIDKNIIEKINLFLQEYRCSKCFQSLIINIERMKRNNILYLTINCKNNHRETKSISDFLKENKFTIENDFDFYDLVTSDNIKKEENNLSKYKAQNRINYRRYDVDNLFEELEMYLICFKCKIIFDLKAKQLNKINHDHFLFHYYKKGQNNNENKYQNSKHFFKIKDFNYLGKKIKQEKKYYNNLKELIIKNNLKNKYFSYLNQIKSEIKLFSNYYEQYMNKKSSRNFQNLSNIFNHTILLFKLEEKNINDNTLKKEIENLNNELLSLYSQNSFKNEEKTVISKYEVYKLNPPDRIFVTTSLDEPYFAAAGIGLYIYKIEENSEKYKDEKHKNALISKVENVNINTMIYIDNKKLIAGGNQGILLFKFNGNYKNYNINFHINKNEEIRQIIKTYDNYFISYGNYLPICKWEINKEENKIDNLFILKTEKIVLGICEISNKYFAYQTEDYIYILNYKNFKEHIKIKYKIQSYIYRRNGINKLTDKIIGTISYNSDQLDFFDVETGEKLFEISNDDNGNQVFYNGFLRTKREKEEIEIITLSENIQYMRRYGYCLDMKVNNNKIEILSQTSDEWWYIDLRHIFEMNDKTILISGEKDLYALFYP